MNIKDLKKSGLTIQAAKVEDIDDLIEIQSTTPTFLLGNPMGDLVEHFRTAIEDKEVILHIVRNSLLDKDENHLVTFSLGYNAVTPLNEDFKIGLLISEWVPLTFKTEEYYKSIEGILNEITKSKRFEKIVVAVRTLDEYRILNKLGFKIMDMTIEKFKTCDEAIVNMGLTAYDYYFIEKFL